MNVLKHILFIAMSISAISLHAATVTWQGTTDTDWETATNWSGGAVPTAEDDVIIPGGLSCYPTAAAASVCRYLYMASGARLAGQELLTYEKAFVDVTLPANRYVRFTPPLQETYTGDLFTAEQGGEWTNFENSHFAGVEGTSGPNRVFPGATYISMFAQAGTNYDAYYNIEARSATTTWDDPFNALAHRFTEGEGFDVWVDNGDNPATTATFHFPGGDTEYTYYNQSGKEGESADITRTSASGHFIFDAGTTGEGRKDYNFASNGTAMFATGNPTMGLMNIRLFMEENVQTHKNITPFLYRHNNVYADRGTESILYYNAASKRLFSVSGSAADNEVPAGSDDPQISDESDNAYIQPNEGFRLMSGETTVFSIEPKLLGNYIPKSGVTKCEYEYYGVPTYYSLFDRTKYGKLSNVEDGEHAKYNMSVSITATDDPKVVCINNFVRRGSVYAHIDVDNHTLTIPNGSPVFYLAAGYWYEGDYHHSLGANRTVCIYGCANETPDFGQQFVYNYLLFGISLYRTYKVTNIVLPTSHVVLDYAFTAGGDSIKITSRKPFVLYSEQFEIYNEPMAYHDQNEAEAYWVYKRIEINKPVNSLDDFILPETLGGYNTVVSSKEGSPAGGVSAGDTISSISISRLKGVYDYVLVDGIYPGVYGHPVIGRITDGEAEANNVTLEEYYTDKSSSLRIIDWILDVFGHERYAITVTAKKTQYRLTILNGQLINEVSANDISQNYYLYNIGRQDSMVFTWYTDVTVTKQEQEYKHLGLLNWGWVNVGDPTVVTLPDRWQQNNQIFASHIDSNPDGDKFPGFYMSVSDLDLCVFSHVRDAVPGTAETGGDPGGSAGEIIIPKGTDQPHPVTFTASMFAANKADFATRLAALAPARKSAKATQTPMLEIKALSSTGKKANTLVVLSPSADAGFNRYEDAPLFDAADAAFTFATLAGQQVVGVNVLPVWDNIPLFITDNATLTFNGIDTYEQPLVLFDAIENKEYALTEGCNVALTVNSGEEAGRWFIRKPAGIASDCRQTTDGGKLTAWNPQHGTLVVRTADEACNVSLFAMSGQRIAATEADGLATFHNVPTGTYLIVVTANGKTQQLKTNVQ